ncbi:MAG: integrase family protein [Proteobacteria bacterium]|nr:integrase family protein [Pseudomonadota bacterium]
MKIKLNQTVVKELLPPEGKQVDVWDDDVTGFGVRVTPKGKKTFFVLARVNSRLVRATVGKSDTMTAEAARTKAKKMLVDMQEGRNPNDEVKCRRSGALTVGGVFKTFMETRKDRRQELTARTQEHYQQVFDSHLAHLKGRHVSELTSTMVQDLHAKIGTTKGTNIANQAIRLLRRLLNFSQGRHGVPLANPCKGTEWFKDGRRNVVIKPGDFKQWYDTVDGMENETARDYLLLLLFSGLRRTEGFCLEWQHVDLHGKTLTIPDTKNGEPHTLPLSTFLHKLLSDRYERWHKPTGYVFPGWSKTGHIVNQQRAMKLLKDAGFSYTLHDLRRTFITCADKLNFSPWTVKRLANHKQTDVTGKHYVVYDIDRLREPMEKISVELLRMARDEYGKVIELQAA